MIEQQPTRIKNLSIASITALTGCVSLVVILVALVAGLWLDAQLGQRGPATICLLIASMPLSLYLMTWLALRLVRQIRPPATVAKAGADLEQTHKDAAPPKP